MKPTNSTSPGRYKRGKNRSKKSTPPSSPHGSSPIVSGLRADWRSGFLNLGGGSEQNLDEFEMSALTARAEEEEALNRAILMSIQDADSSHRDNLEGVATNDVSIAIGDLSISIEENNNSNIVVNDTANDINTDSNETIGGILSDKDIREFNIGILISMGFNRKQSIDALISNNNDVEAAADFLLN
jgi:hypothetical protein